MGWVPLSHARWELVLPEGLYERLQRHLFPGDGDEHGAVIRAGLAHAGGGMRLLAREVHLARDGHDFVAGKRGYKMFRAEFVRDHIVACRAERLVYLNVHNHGGTSRVAFSRTTCAAMSAAIRRCSTLQAICQLAHWCSPLMPLPATFGYRMAGGWHSIAPSSSVGVGAFSCQRRCREM